MSGRGPDGSPRLPLRSHNYDLSCTHSMGVQIEACLLWLVFLDQACAPCLTCPGSGVPTLPCRAHCPPSHRAEGKLSLVIREVSQTWRPVPGTGMGPSCLKSCTLAWKQRAPRSRVAGPKGPKATPSQAHRRAMLQPPGCVCAAARQQGQLRGKGTGDWGRQGRKWKRGRGGGKGVGSEGMGVLGGSP